MSGVAVKQGVNQGAYEAMLRTLSEASVEHHFDAFTDIAWDDPEHAIDPADPRWILPDVDPLGRTQWYRSLPRERQIEVGFYRQTNVVKVGLQFEQVLIAGLMMYCLDLPNGRAEFRYSTHEATEECHHTQMFQEFVNRTGLDVPGAHSLFRTLGPFLPLAAKHLPFIFFIGVLGGEEPIDYVQKVMLRSGAEMHPLLHRISQIHVAEEARHIGFAHQYLEHRAPHLNRLQRGFASVLTPVLMRVLCDAIVVPGPKAVRDMGIPKEVVREVWWGSPESRKFLRDMFGDVRMLAEETGLMNPVSRRIWRAMGIAGRPNRFRSEPAPAAD
ncbi:AurF N-oxygenase family protein [Pimelobacter simplex]|uniref:AurF N-oxygenase family protein n=1 Tax=Nocardioides simplex TaxID=2045 RepID=UPI00214F8ED8|nr:diiron oxygenase [Pimelobacter simplex]UUW87956.1 diiron oxygenase [Pimelobacter simplex]UUW97461.1 diiron oxygenase [Pimelobacter simplex]